MAINVLDTFKPAQIFLRCFILVSNISVIAQNLAIVCYCCLHFCRRSTRVLVKLKAWVFNYYLDRQLNTFRLVRETEKTKSQVLHTLPFKHEGKVPTVSSLICLFVCFFCGMIDRSLETQFSECIHL